MAVAAAGEEAFRQGDDGAAGLSVGTGFAGGENVSVLEVVFHPDADGTGKDIFPLPRAVPAEGVVGGVLEKSPAEVGLGAEIAGGEAPVERGVISLGRFERVITLVADVAETRHTDARGQREQRDEVLGDFDVGGLHPAIVEAIKHGAGFTDDLLSLDGGLQALRRERGDVESVVVEAGEGQPPIGVIEPAGSVIADESALLQAPGVPLEGDSVIETTEVETR